MIDGVNILFVTMHVKKWLTKTYAKKSLLILDMLLRLILQYFVIYNICLYFHNCALIHFQINPTICKSVDRRFYIMLTSTTNGNST